MTTVFNGQSQAAPIAEEKVTTTEETVSEMSTTNLSNSEVKQESVVTTTLSSAILSEEKVNSIATDKPEITTHTATSDTSINKQNNEENLIPVSVNEQTRLLQVQSTTEPSENNTFPVPIVVNNQPVILQPDNVEINETTEPKIVELTTQPAEMTKIFSELHKVVDEQHEHSTETVIATTTNSTHMNIAVVESTENTSAMDNMSPFLPEIDNDTFVNKLHLGEHIIPQMQNDTHDDEVVEMSPPRLDNDQMNVTNPRDTNLGDPTLAVVPLESHDNEILDKMVATVPPKISEDSNQTEYGVVPVVIQDQPVEMKKKTC
ncbi:hypothetical protein GEV33_000665 [Tenebrio molitor]|uniref:Uncharacterized protein n=1 Tax=Tenebrio molitor TaxID=7067 RepID=A0A8J6LQU8_TENMO|nr:hypothetical protein GEV33_000665 [Tenebrio molitor]